MHLEVIHLVMSTVTTSRLDVASIFTSVNSAMQQRTNVGKCCDVGSGETVHGNDHQVTDTVISLTRGKANLGISCQ